MLYHYYSQFLVSFSLVGICVLVILKLCKVVSIYLYVHSSLQVTEMVAEYIPPREDVILQNDISSELYIVVSGAAVSYILAILHSFSISIMISTLTLFGKHMNSKLG